MKKLDNLLSKATNSCKWGHVGKIKEYPKEIHLQKTLVEGEFPTPMKKETWSNYIHLH